MTKRQYFLRSVNVLNAGLLVILLAILYLGLEPLISNDAGVIDPPSAREIKVVKDGERIAPIMEASIIDYSIVTEKNIFHPQRRLPSDRPATEAVKPDVVLYGTLITDDLSLAFLEDLKAPYATAGRGKRPMTLKKGGYLNGYRLEEVDADRIVLVKGRDRIVALIADKGKVKPREGLAAGSQTLGTQPARIPPRYLGNPQTTTIPGTAAVPVTGR
ncbi:MAG: hypothetical protein PHY31_03990 [Smithellaceae bacterium]|nr:hypothetical protein [Smithellaceae bacterium]